MRQSLYMSRNLSTIKLGMALGEQTVIGEARRFGITTPLPPYPSIHIGAREVKPIELVAGVHGVREQRHARRADRHPAHEDRQGNILYQSTVKREQVLDPEHNWLLLDMMRDVMRRPPRPRGRAAPMQTRARLGSASRRAFMSSKSQLCSGSSTCSRFTVTDTGYCPGGPRCAGCIGSTRVPLFANAVYAATSSIGFTSRAPYEWTIGWQCVVMPKRRASPITVCSPSAMRA